MFIEEFYVCGIPISVYYHSHERIYVIFLNHETWYRLTKKQGEIVIALLKGLSKKCEEEAKFNSTC